MTTVIKREFDTTIELKENAMLRHSPHLFEEWDFEKNDELGLDVYKVTKGSKKKAWWIGNCGHEWESVIRIRVSGCGCPYCSNIRILKGFNDMWTTNPELAKMLVNPEDGYKYTQNSNEKTDWKCLNCNNILKSKNINNVKRVGLYCPRCSDKMKFPEKIMYHTLIKLDMEFDCQKTFKWSKGRIYDFYIPSLDCIIETHGVQHYKQSRRGRSLQEEQMNDKYKHSLATKNGIKKYIIIDCRTSDFEYIKNNMINSKLGHLLNMEVVDWLEIERLSQKSIYIEFLNLWNRGLTLAEISNVTKYSRNTISMILRNFEKMNMCKYDNKRGKKGRKPSVILQFDMEMNFIKEWSGLDEIERNVDISKSAVSMCCNGKINSSKGFIWKFKDKINTNI